MRLYFYIIEKLKTKYFIRGNPYNIEFIQYIHTKDRMGRTTKTTTGKKTSNTKTVKADDTNKEPESKGPTDLIDENNSDEVEVEEEIEKPTVTNWANETPTNNYPKNDSNNYQNAPSRDITKLDAAEAEELGKLTVNDTSIDDLMRVLIRRGYDNSNPALAKGAERLLLQLKCVPLSNHRDGGHRHSSPFGSRGRGRGRGRDRGGGRGQEVREGREGGRGRQDYDQDNNQTQDRGGYKGRYNQRYGGRDYNNRYNNGPPLEAQLSVTPNTVNDTEPVVHDDTNNYNDRRGGYNGNNNYQGNNNQGYQGYQRNNRDNRDNRDNRNYNRRNNNYRNRDEETVTAQSLEQVTNN